MASLRWLLALVLAASGVPASAVTLVSTAAGYAGTVTSNCAGEAGNVEVTIIYVAPGTGSGGCERQGIVEFDLAAVSPAAVSSATLTLYDGQVGNSEGRFWTVDVYGYAGDGQVTGSDLYAGSYTTSAIWDRYSPTADRFTIDVTAFVSELLANGAAYAGFNLRPPEFSVGGSSFTIFTYYGGAGSSRPPTLELTPVPLPAGMLFFSSALVALGFVGRGSPVV